MNKIGTENEIRIGNIHYFHPLVDFGRAQIEEPFVFREFLVFAKTYRVVGGYIEDGISSDGFPTPYAEVI